VIFCIFLLSSINVFTDELPSARYVTSKDGLNKREAASTLSEIIGTLLYGSRVVIYERSDDVDVVDGITDYWYKCHGGGWFWVFGGYLSIAIPDDIDPILGYWNTDRGERYYWDFRPDHTVSSGRKETDTGWIGTWTLFENKLIIKTIPTEFNTGESQIFEIVLTVINRDRIFLEFTDGNGEFLDRNSYFF